MEAQPSGQSLPSVAELDNKAAEIDVNISELNVNVAESKVRELASEAPRGRGTGLPEYQKLRKKLRQNAQLGASKRDQQDYTPIQDISLPRLLACQTHLGHATSLWNPRNSSYIMGERDGIHIISLDVTAAYLKRASKVIQEVAKRGGIILFVGTRYGQDNIVVEAAKTAKGYHVFDRWLPGALTNGQQILGHCRLKIVNGLDEEMEDLRPYLVNQPVARPDLVVCLNPLENEACLHECGLFNIPTIGIIDTDADASWVTYPIPANDDSLRSVELIASTLASYARVGQKERLDLAQRGELTYHSLDMKKVEYFSGAVAVDPVQGGDDD